MNILVLFLLILLSFHQSQRACAHPFTDECLSNAGCPANAFCDGGGDDGIVSGDCGTSSCKLRPRRCAPRLHLLQTCRRMDSPCQEGLYCARDEGGGFGTLCTARKLMGESCHRNARNPCADGLVCAVRTSTCSSNATGIEGDPCIIFSDCQQFAGFYCKAVARIGTRVSFRGICTRKKSPGSPCTSLNGDAYECDDGFCARNTSIMGSFTGICVLRRRHGQSCSTTDQCVRFVDRYGRRSDDVCNKNFRGRLGFDEGICMAERDFLLRPGARCDPKYDKCDRHGGLVVRNTVETMYVFK